jgi:hypothetical protein
MCSCMMMATIGAIQDDVTPTSQICRMNDIDEADREKRKKLALPTIVQNKNRAQNMTPAMNLRGRIFLKRTHKSLDRSS